MSMCVEQKLKMKVHHAEDSHAPFSILNFKQQQQTFEHSNFEIAKHQMSIKTAKINKQTYKKNIQFIFATKTHFENSII